MNRPAYNGCRWPPRTGAGGASVLGAERELLPCGAVAAGATTCRGAHRHVTKPTPRAPARTRDGTFVAGGQAAAFVRALRHNVSDLADSISPASWPDADGDLPAAAILHRGAEDVDALLAAIVARQRELGRRVRGLLMTYPEPAAGCAGAMVLVDIDTGDRYLVSQPMGSGSTACRADPRGFAQASGVLRAALHAAPDLVVSNRFGSLEAEGGGFAAELLELMAAGIPLLTVVHERFAAPWRRFSGGAALLPASADEVQRWLDLTLPAAAAGGPAGPGAR